MRITELPQAASVAQTDDLAIDVPGGRTYRVPRSILAPAPYIATIPTGQWSGSGSDYYITVTASNVTADSILYPFFDSASEALLNGPVWAVPDAGSFTIHTSAIPSGTVTISVLLAGVVGEAQYQVLSDVYSKSQTDALVAQSTAETVNKIGFTSRDYTYTYTIEANGDLSITAEQLGYSTPSGYVPLALGFFNTGATLVFSRGVQVLTTSGNCVWLHNFSSSRITAVMSVTVVYRKNI